MAPLDDLYQALAISGEQKKAIADSNPYTPAANIFGQLGTTIATSGPQYSLRDKLIYGAITGLFGGALTGLADRRNSNAQAAYIDVVRRGLAGETNIQQPDELSNSLFSSAIEAKNNALFKREQAESIANQELRRDIEKSTKIATITEAVKNPKEAEKIIRAGQEALAKVNAPKASGVRIEGTGTAPVTPAGGETDEATAKPGKSRGVEGTILDQIGEEAARLKELELSPSELATARELMSAKKSELDRQYKRVEEAQANSQSLKSLADTAESAVQRAGYTGTGGNALQTLAGYLGTVNSDQANKFAAGQELQSLQPDIIKAARPAGVGAMSDPEMRVWLSFGVGLDKAASTNQMIIDKMRYASNIQDQYVDFMRTNQAKGTPVSEAESQWKNIVKNNPFLVKEKAGTLSPNPLWQSSSAPILSEPSTVVETTAAVPTQAITPEMARAELARRGIR